ncbi:acyl-CoA N-acyltransferase [Hygrophoropsis aurantiaca]|uniref:Acyl-CoA N-acyltransferase n=1 Tax=Hygrophoropsis aurantiaca TaxID=72124 RepID=A0ACB8APK5_9AGAM|nr:acyl-CoA N-acyltransferase [Hygrophoropsis aurantiaca]
MSPGLAYEILAISGDSPSEATIESFSALRLLSLQTDPESFGSTYERELAFNKDIWFQRLSSPFKRTFISSARDEGGSDRWVGTVTMLGPSEFLPSTSEILEKAGVDRSCNVYILAGMWVHPDYRGMGMGSTLVMAGLDWVRSNNDPKNDADGHGRKTVLLIVANNNPKGRALYEKIGFKDWPEVVSDDENETWMMMHCA